MAVRRDYYEVLGVGRQASADELKRAFRKIAMDSHPDRNPDDPAAAARFKEASEAYAVLSDPGRRRSYDMFGHAAADMGGGPAVDFTDMPLADLFETFFGGGAGQIRRAQQSIFGSVVTASTCPTCQGAGRVLRSPCAECRGQGRVERTRRLMVRIPAGVDNGSQIRLSGEGEAGVRGGQPGDLYVVMRVKPHPQLDRRDQDVIYKLHVNIVQAAVGDQIEVPTLDGPVEIAIPPGTQYGQTFRLAGRGMPDVRGGRRGDQYVLVQIVVPKDLNLDQKALLRKVGGLTGKPEKISKGFFEKLRDAISLD